jgi:hypothetical protein
MSRTLKGEPITAAGCNKYMQLASLHSAETQFRHKSNTGLKTGPQVLRDVLGVNSYESTARCARSQLAQNPLHEVQKLKPVAR